MGDFPNQVQVAQAPATIGDFCDKNPRYSYDAGPGGLVAGIGGAVVGHFAWATAPLDGDGAAATVTNTGFGPVSGFIHREQQALIVNYLASSGLTIQQGFGLTLMIGGGFWAYNAGATQAVPGMKAYANFADGSVTFAAAGSPANGGTSTASVLAAGAGSAFTGSITGALMTVSAVASGTLYNGTVVSGTNVVTGTQIVSQVLPLLAGETAKGVGRYNVSIGEQTVASESLTGAFGIITVGGTVAGNFAVGQTLTGSGVNAGLSITDLGTGTGLAGTYILNGTQTLSSQAINTASNVETKWFARSSGLPGEVVKISDKPLG